MNEIKRRSDLNVIEKIERSIRPSNSDIENLLNQLQAEQDAHSELKANVQTIEWICDDGMQCPACNGTWVKQIGHKDNCWLNNAIKKGNGNE